MMLDTEAVHTNGDYSKTHNTLHETDNVGIKKQQRQWLYRVHHHRGAIKCTNAIYYIQNHAVKYHCD